MTQKADFQASQAGIGVVNEESLEEIRSHIDGEVEVQRGKLVASIVGVDMVYCREV